MLRTDSHHVSPSVLLFFDHERYLFNAGEGLQRHLTSHKVSMTKIEQVLATRVCTSTLSGLPGMLLSTKSLNPSTAGLIGQESATKLYGRLPSRSLTWVQQPCSCPCACSLRSTTAAAAGCRVARRRRGDAGLGSHRAAQARQALASTWTPSGRTSTTTSPSR